MEDIQLKRINKYLSEVGYCSRRAADKLIEEGRIAIRNVRRDALHQVHDYGKEENISEDEIKGREIDLQGVTDKHIKELNSQQEKKEQEIMEV